VATGVLIGVLAGSGPVDSREPASRAERGAPRFDTVVIDAGHGGRDHGARGPNGLLEKEVVLDLAQRLQRLLGEQGLTVVQTRDADRFVELEERTSLANEAGGDLFISIHANASQLAGVRGIETFFASPDATDDAARELAAAENLVFEREEGPPDGADPLLAILGDMIATEHLAESQEFARMAQRRIATREASRSRGVKQAPFVVLMGVQMPAVLVEVGFITNRREAQALGREAERERLARGLAEAVGAFQQRTDARNGVADLGPEEG